MGVSSWKRQKAFLSVSIKQFPALYIKIAKSKKKKGTKKGDSDALIEARERGGKKGALTP